MRPANLITTNDIRYYLIEINRLKPLKDSTMSNAISVLKSFFTWLQNEDMIAQDPTKKNQGTSFS